MIILSPLCFAVFQHIVLALGNATLLSFSTLFWVKVTQLCCFCCVCSDLPWFSPKKSSDTLTVVSLPQRVPLRAGNQRVNTAGDVGSRELNSSLPAVGGDQNGDRRVNNNSTINAEVSKMHQESKGVSVMLIWWSLLCNRLGVTC